MSNFNTKNHEQLRRVKAGFIGLGAVFAICAATDLYDPQRREKWSQKFHDNFPALSAAVLK